jgi:hypothetical protein
MGAIHAGHGVLLENGAAQLSADILVRAHHKDIGTSRFLMNIQYSFSLTSTFLTKSSRWVIMIERQGMIV